MAIYTFIKKAREEEQTKDTANYYVDFAISIIMTFSCFSQNINYPLYTLGFSIISL